MLKYKGSRWPGETEIIGNTGNTLGTCLDLQNNKVALQERTSQELACRNVIKQVTCDSKSRRYFGVSFREDRKRPREEINRTPYRYQVENKRHGVMKDVGQFYFLESQSSQFNRKTLNDEQHEVDPHKACFSVQEFEAASISDLSPGRISGHSDLTAEDMIEDSPGTTKEPENGSNLLIEGKIIERKGTIAQSQFERPIIPERPLSAELTSSLLNKHDDGNIVDAKPVDLLSTLTLTRNEGECVNYQLPPISLNSGIAAQDLDRKDHEEDDHWLQLALGNKFYAEGSRLNDDNSTKTTLLQEETQHNLVTLQLLPDCQDESSKFDTSPELCLAGQIVSPLVSNEQEVYGKLNPFMATGNRPGRSETTDKVLVVASSSYLTEHSGQSCFSQISASQYVHNLLPNINDVSETNNENVSFARFYSSATQLPTTALTHHVATDGMWSYSGSGNVRIHPIATANTCWYPAANQNKALPWRDFQGEALRRTTLKPILTDMTTRLAADRETETLTTIQGVHPVLKDWNELPSRLPTHLDFGSDVYLKHQRFERIVSSSQDVIALVPEIANSQSETCNREMKSFVSPCFDSTVSSPSVRTKSLGSTSQDGTTTHAAINLQPDMRRYISSSLQRCNKSLVFDESSHSQTLQGQERLKVSKSSSHEAGVWFTLQAVENLTDDEALPQIQKTYVRIKDGKMPISVLRKYLATKLGLENDSEVQITCRGQLLMPNMSLKHVRDAIWSSSIAVQTQTTTCFPFQDAASLVSGEHIMILMYKRHLESLPSACSC